MSALLKSVEETAEMLSLSPWTIRHYLRIGKLAQVKIGRRILVEESEIQDFVKRCKEVQQSSSDK